MFPVFAFNLLGHAFNPSLRTTTLLRQRLDFSFECLLFFARCRDCGVQFAVFDLKCSELLFESDNLEVCLL